MTGRPRKAPDEQRAERLPGVRLTSAERHHVELMAERAGLTVAEFSRRAILGQNVRARRAASDDRAIAEVNRVGANLHQIVRALNFKQGIPRDIADTMAECRAALERLAADGS
ncbi:plasmid mobilization relaxosome protein MobC [Aquibium sp. LZ166]|uniref:Plasmid mobilization relaxosome protein MobC n=1 Tax=Aquibium pacificus TaxID=3153579 RepID=A0ABV3SSJ2_9HYPH